MRGRFVTTFFATWVLLVRTAEVAQAQEPPSPPVFLPSTGMNVTGGQDPAAGVWDVRATPASEGSEGGAPQVAVREKECRTYHLPPAGVGRTVQRELRDQLASAAGELVAGEWYYLECRWVDTDEVDFADMWQYNPAEPEAGPSPEVLARQAYDQVPLVVPQPRTSPPADAEQIVGFPTWLWVEPAAWQTFSATAAIPGLSVTVTASPRHVTWDTGDGTTFTCAGAGTPWNPAAGDGQTTDCSHTYQYVSSARPSGRYRVTATVTWSVTWEASTGEAGTLADASRTAAFGLAVGERQAVVSYAPG
jgi:hypothetical protein